MRPLTGDVWALEDTFNGGYHLPPNEVDLRTSRTIWDLGANIGLTMAHFAQLASGGEILGVELDRENAEMARRTLAPWQDRCTLIEAAVWVNDTESIGYRRDVGAEQAFRVDPVRANATAKGLSLNTLLEMTPASTVDFVKMDIEGAEEMILTQSTEWAQAVRCIKVEVHRPYTVDRCEADLSRLGFVTEVDTRHGAAVVGIRF